MDLNHFNLWTECHCGLCCYVQHLHIQETELSGKCKKEVTSEDPQNLYTTDEKIGNARILNLVFFPPLAVCLVPEYMSSAQKVVLLSLRRNNIVQRILL
jgi:hypothetical protein